MQFVSIRKFNTLNNHVPWETTSKTQLRQLFEQFYSVPEKKNFPFTIAAIWTRPEVNVRISPKVSLSCSILIIWIWLLDRGCNQSFPSWVLTKEYFQLGAYHIVFPHHDSRCQDTVNAVNNHRSRAAEKDNNFFLKVGYFHGSMIETWSTCKVCVAIMFSGTRRHWCEIITGTIVKPHLENREGRSRLNLVSLRGLTGTRAMSGIKIIR